MVGHSVKASSGKKSLPLKDAVEAWLDDCRARGLSPATINRSYSQATRHVLLPWCEKHGVRTVTQLDGTALGRLAADLNARQLSKWTVGHYLRTINAFASWAGTARAPLPKTRKVAKDVLTLQEMRRLEGAALTVRNALILRLMADIGPREAELVNLQVGDVVVRGGSGFVKVRGKTGERMPPISPEVLQRLKRFIGNRHPAQRLFMSQNRSPRSKQHEPLTTSGIYQIVKDTAERAEFERKVWPHLLRASAITRAVAGGMHPALVAEIFGVSVGVVLMHYSYPSDKQRHDAMMKVLYEDA